MNGVGAALERQAAATLLASFTGPEVPDWLRGRIDAGLGGVCLYGSNRLARVDDTARVAAALHEVRPALLVTLDEEGGAVTRLEAASGSSVPGNAALGAVDDPALTRDVARALGELLASTGIDVDLAPCADVNVDAMNPVIGVRSFSADPEVAARHVAAFVAGLQEAGVAACVKHFPGHGATTVDSHLALPEVAAPADVLAARELAPFRAAIDGGAAAIMTAHLRVPALDPDRPATVSHRILTDLLRGELGFGGVIVTDALDMAGIGGRASIPANVVRSLAAGADLCCLGPDGTDDLMAACIDAVVDAVRSGDLAEDRLADAAARVASVPPSRSWPAEPRRARLDLPTTQIGLRAARRAVRTEGSVDVPLHGAHLVELRRPPTLAEGAVPWGLAAALADLEPTSTSEQLDDPDALAAVLDRAVGRPLVVVVRDPQTDGRRAALLAALVEARADAVVVDMGWPGDAGGPAPAAVSGAARIVTYGPSRASAEVVAQLLVGCHTRVTSTGGSVRG